MIDDDDYDYDYITCNSIHMKFPGHDMLIDACSKSLEYLKNTNGYHLFAPGICTLELLAHGLVMTNKTKPKI